ncbi:type I secretion outer membrane protein, TolC family [delta proteobacterium NaphS2]|nr:type I secretion outer membrane protein, TolC family [delta proteobacterium NaphS2]
MTKIRSRKQRIRPILLAGILFWGLLSCWGCQKPLPELNPDRYASSAPEKYYKSETKALKPPPPPIEKNTSLSPENLNPPAKKLSLADLVDIALRINPTTQSTWEQARAAAADWASSRGQYYPTISGDASGYGLGGNSSTAYYGTVSLSLSYLLFDFGGRAASVESARQALMAANWNHNQSIQDILRNVPQAYYTYLGNLAQVRASESDLEEALTSLKSTEQRKKAGVSTIADVLQARSRVDQVRLDLVTNRGAVKISLGELATAVGWPANADFDVVEGPEDLPLNDISENTQTLIGLALRDRPDLAAARANLRQSQAELKKAQSALWPRLTATGNAGWSGIDANFDASSYFDIGDINSSGTSYYGGLSLEIPLFEGFSLRNNIRAAEAGVKAARADLRQKEESVISDVWSSFYNVQTAAQQVESSETLLISSKESFRVSLARYRAGVADIVELLNAQSTLTSARTRRVQAQTDLFISYAELMHAIGAELPADGIKDTSMRLIEREVSANGR